MKRPLEQILGHILVLALLASLSHSNSAFAQADTTASETITPQLSETLEESMLIKGTISQQINEHDKAIEMFLLGLEKNERSMPLLLGLSESYLSLEDYHSALFYIDQAISLDEQNPVLIAQKMNVYSAQKNSDKLRALLALAETKSIRSQDIDDFRFLMREGLVSIGNSNENSESSRSGEMDSIAMVLEAIEALNSSISPEADTKAIEDLIEKSEAENAMKKYLKGQLAYANEHYENALTLFEASISENPKNVSSWAFLVKSASKSGAVEKAAAFADQAVLLFPFQKEIELANIHRLIASKELEEARKRLQAVDVDAEWEPEKKLLEAQLRASIEAKE